MVKIKNYIVPTTDIVHLELLDMITSSTYKYICTNCCKFWHLCRDREGGKLCYDKKY